MKATPLHQAMLDPATYPGESGPIGFRETHISQLYFTANTVYKIKKPVDFGFLRFISLDERRHFCEEEVRLNRRLCPDVYLRVASISELNGRFQVNGAGAAIEYAVVMKRLPEERMLDFLIRTRDRSLPGAMENLGRRLAVFHREAEICRNDEGIPNLETVERNWGENFTQTLPFTGHTLSTAAHHLLRTYVAGFLGEQAPLLLSREISGYVREGHGDLHAEHVCLGDSVCIYDCIEFNRRFRVADIAADLAFLLMDLEFRERRDLATRLLSSYRNVWGENGGMDLVLPFYKVYRAFVRGKVESFLAADTSAVAELRREAEETARRYFNQALGYLCPPLLILTCGLMGVGKSTIGRALAQALGARLLRSDEIRKELAGLSSSEKENVPFGRGIYSTDFTTATYRTLLQRALAAAHSGETVVADASFARQSERDRFRHGAARAGIPCLILHLECDQAMALDRLDRRQAMGEDASDGRREVLARQTAIFDSLDASQNHVIRVDTSRDIYYNVHFILTGIIKKIGMRP
jgi:uncharacterized protein